MSELHDKYNICSTWCVDVIGTKSGDCHMDALSEDFNTINCNCSLKLEREFPGITERLKWGYDIGELGEVSLEDEDS